jgi:hypothetical protein
MMSAVLPGSALAVARRLFASVGEVCFLSERPPRAVVNDGRLQDAEVVSVMTEMRRLNLLAHCCHSQCGQ